MGTPALLVPLASERRRSMRVGERRAAHVARGLEEEVIAAGWPVGQVMGSESCLVERYHVSRAVFREAVRLLEHRQVAEMRRGPGGGLVVVTPTSDAATEAVATYLEYAGTTFAQLIEVRSVLEPLIASLAAKRIRETGIASLREILTDDADADDLASISRQYTGLRDAMAAIAGNPVLHLFTQVLLRLSVRTIEHADFDWEPEIVHVAPEHRRNAEQLVDAVTAGEAGRAETIARTHIAGIAEWHATVDRAAARSQVTAHVSPATLPPAPRSKLAEVAAGRIMRLIRKQGWPVGRLLGSEEELAGYCGVSRAVFREAVRLLEHHHVATMRRGRRGGLVVAEPGAVAVVDAVSRYLEYRGFVTTDLHVVRRALELHCVDLVMGRPASEERAPLKQLLTRAAAPAPGSTLAAQDLHVRVAEASGNPVISLFVQVLANLCTYHCQPVVDVADGLAEDCVAATERAHQAIVSAMVAGDRGLARHRMTRHLDALQLWSERAPQEGWSR